MMFFFCLVNAIMPPILDTSAATEGTTRAARLTAASCLTFLPFVELLRAASSSFCLVFSQLKGSQSDRLKTLSIGCWQNGRAIN